jgi:pre-mRNA-splicing helicase BRR2
MPKPIYPALLTSALCCLQSQSSIVFVPTRKHARLTAMDILGYASADGLPKRFLAVRKLIGSPGSVGCS